MTTAMVIVIANVCLVFAIASGVLTMIVARSKGYKPAGWFFAGFFFWILALIAVAGIAQRADSVANSRYTEMEDDEVDRATAQTPQQ